MYFTLFNIVLLIFNVGLLVVNVGCIILLSHVGNEVMPVYCKQMEKLERKRYKWYNILNY